MHAFLEPKRNLEIILSSIYQSMMYDPPLGVSSRELVQHGFLGHIQGIFMQFSEDRIWKSVF